MNIKANLLNLKLNNSFFFSFFIYVCVYILITIDTNHTKFTCFVSMMAKVFVLHN